MSNTPSRLIKFKVITDNRAELECLLIKAIMLGNFKEA